MKNLFITLFMVAASMLFSGCTGFIVNADYKSEYIDGVKENRLSKVQEKIVVVKNVENVVHQKQEYIIAADHETYIPSSFTENISKDFLSQYFKDVEISNEKGFFEFDIKMISVDRFFEFQRPRYVLEFSVLVTKEGTEILSKKYKEKTTPPALISGKYWIDFKRNNNEFSEMGIHKEFFEILEEKVKPDLLKALKENI